MRATLGEGTNVPIYILGSSLFGAQLAAALGLPYGFASHFAPAALRQAVALHRRSFQPSAQLARPYVIAGVNVVAAGSAAEARAQLLAVQRARVAFFVGRGEPLSDAVADGILASPQGASIAAMMQYNPWGTWSSAGD